MDNPCPNIAMPPARKDSVLRPYDVPVRPESVVDLDFKRTREQKIIGLINIARSFNVLGKPYILKKCFAYAKNSLNKAGVRFIEEDATISRPVKFDA